MSLKKTALLAVTALAISSPALAQDNADKVPDRVFKTADIIDNQKNKLGEVTVTQADDGVLFHVKAENMPAGWHGMHLHKVGTCDDAEAGFKDSQGHIMPEENKHGFLNPDGYHSGDLPNLIVAENGMVEVELYSEDVEYQDDEDGDAVFDADGTALVIHADKDDHYSQPIGGAGDRIACAVLK
ncbi:MAG: superoxide dismutase [Micavibrio sp.]|nr:superoxide dismutase [Micavibrio sp.]|tara:strand:- start:691 stop:1242 length:552 start_codon:yes stop_codon:yes gene_type:complete